MKYDRAYLDRCREDLAYHTRKLAELTEPDKGARRRALVRDLAVIIRRAEEAMRQKEID